MGSNVAVFQYKQLRQMQSVNCIWKFGIEKLFSNGFLTCNVFAKIPYISAFISKVDYSLQAKSFFDMFGAATCLHSTHCSPLHIPLLFALACAETGRWQYNNIKQFLDCWFHLRSVNTHMLASDRPNHCLNSPQWLAKLKDTREAKGDGANGKKHEEWSLGGCCCQRFG